jgi:hypothetical protein
MVTIAEIRVALHEKNFTKIRALHTRSKTEGIQHCDEFKQSTVALQMLEVSFFKTESPGHTRTLNVMLDAVERGNHPYQDEAASASMLSDAAIAQAQIDAWVGKKL